jgi:hypothetical protein
MVSLKNYKHEKKNFRTHMTTLLFKAHLELKLSLIQWLDEED